MGEQYESYLGAARSPRRPLATPERCGAVIERLEHELRELRTDVDALATSASDSTRHYAEDRRCWKSERKERQLELKRLAKLVEALTAEHSAKPGVTRSTSLGGRWCALAVVVGIGIGAVALAWPTRRRRVP